MENHICVSSYSRHNENPWWNLFKIECYLQVKCTLWMATLHRLTERSRVMWIDASNKVLTQRSTSPDFFRVFFQWNKSVTCTYCKYRSMPNCINIYLLSIWAIFYVLANGLIVIYMGAAGIRFPASSYNSTDWKPSYQTMNIVLMALRHVYM